MEESEILLIRHGFSLANYVSWNNQSGLEEALGSLSFDENVPLDDHGVKQAQETGKFLSELLHGKKVLFLVSPYQRAKATLENILCQFNDVDGVDIVFDKTIRELDAGIHFGKTKDEFREKYPEEYEKYISIIESLKDGKDKRFISYVGGEGHQDVRRRVYGFCRKLEQLSSEKVDGHLKYDYICVVSHNFVNQWIYYWLNNKQMLDVKGIKNCEVIVGKGEDAGKSLFVPETFVSKDYIADLEKYNEKGKR